jgi:hypothetical protein
MLDSFLQFGLGAALIGLYFIPENKRLNKIIKDQADQRVDDLINVIVPFGGYLKEAKGTDALILQELMKRNG